MTGGSFLHTGPGRYQAPPSYFLIRGDPNAKGSPMTAGFVTVATYGNPPSELPPGDGRTSGRRRALAEWLASPQNPLTARVMVNRVWHHHFGRGIVATLDNFGKMGEPPSHPELLDWLASDFVEHRYDIRRLIQTILTSRAYRMPSVPRTSEPAARAASTTSVRNEPDMRGVHRRSPSRRRRRATVRGAGASAWWGTTVPVRQPS